MHENWKEVAEKLSNLQPFIQYLQDTREDEWAIDVVRTKGNQQNCLFGHLVNWYYGKGYQGDVSLAWDLFEEMWSTTFFVYEINDGRNPDYPQPTPKQRVLAFMKNLWLGQEMDTQTGMAHEASTNN